MFQTEKKKFSFLQFRFLWLRANVKSVSRESAGVSVERLSVSTTGSGIYSRQREEGDGEDTEAGSDGFADPRLRYLVAVTDGGDSHLETGGRHCTFQRPVHCTYYTSYYLL